ncbi:DUF6412 domain-containing protein [Trebonia sp.]|uniref:DUF6412 domain-containing protein n=1 Tax=Trebonia sp. TaxID=2767075 RepID=UPI0026108531|nr:DUF6412 domain-containing protein [Trebonia sp.]
MLSALSGLWQVAGHLLPVLMWADTPQRAAVLTVAVLAVALVGSFAVGASHAGATARLPVLRRVAALREKSWRVAFVRQRDPDARGRARPRAPSAAAAAA